MRPACTMSGEEAVAALDALHAESARRETYRLEVIARLDETGHTQELSGQGTTRFIATRYRLNHPEVKRDLALATALANYPAVARSPARPARTRRGRPDHPVHRRSRRNR